MIPKPQRADIQVFPGKSLVFGIPAYIPLGSKRVTTSWLFVIFGEHRIMAQLIAKRVLISPLIRKDFPVCHPLLARGNSLP
jgi:hypothetical protein